MGIQMLPHKLLGKKLVVSLVVKVTPVVAAPDLVDRLLYQFRSPAQSNSSDTHVVSKKGNTKDDQEQVADLADDPGQCFE